MEVLRARGRDRAFTLLELLSVTAIIAVLTALLLPALNRAKARAKRIGCVNQLRQLGVAFQSFAHDHNNLFPMAVPAAAGGSLEFTRVLYQPPGMLCFRHFLPLANDVRTPRVLACPSDNNTVAAASFSSLSNLNISYFVGLKADYSKPNSILAGDRNLTLAYVNIGSAARPQVISRWVWTSELHQFKGNLLFSDGHVEEKNSQSLSSALEQVPAIGELALPTAPRRAGTAVLPSASIAPSAGVPASRTEPAVVAPSSGAPPTSPDPVRPSTEPMVRPGGASAIVSGFHATSNSPSAIVSPRVEAGPAVKPEPGDDHGFSLFPASLGTSVVKFVRSSAWWLYLIALVLGAIALIRWTCFGSRSAKNPKSEDRR